MGAVSRLLVLAGLLLWAGVTLLLGVVPWLSRPGLADRLRPYHPGSAAGGGRTRPQSLSEAWGPLVRRTGDRLAAAFGAGEDLSIRLRRIHSPLSSTAFRVRQFAWTLAAFGAAALLSLALSAPVAIDVMMIVGLPLLAFLVIEQRLATASATWQQQVLRELPVVNEQLAMLLSAGFSLGAALNRLAHRGSGCCARDLRLVINRVRGGMSEQAAMAEWARVVRVDAVDRLVAVLALDSATGDLGRLVGLEATEARRESHRRTLELIERRAEQVWIPVTVATLVPGVILLAVPFLSALHTFANA
jgi:tight adherence protein C